MHVDLEDYIHRGVRYVDIINIDGNAGNQLASLVAQSGTSGSTIEFNSELRMGSDDVIWDQLITGTGSTSYMMPKNGVELIANNGKTVREGFNAINLHAGRRIVATCTSIFKNQFIEGGKAWSRVGLFDVSADKTVGTAGSGVYMEYQFNTDVWRLVLNSGYSGADKTSSIDQGSWNIDNLDGNGLSELSLVIDPTKINTFRFEVGSDRGQYITVYYIYNGNQIPLHQFLLNQGSQFILTDNLPVRFECETAEVSDHSMIQMGSNVVSYGGRGQYSKVGVALVETPNEVSTSGGNEFFFMSLKNTDSVRLTTKINRLFFDADGNTPYQYFWKCYLRRNPTTYIGNTYSTIYGTGVESSLGHDAVEYAAMLAANPSNYIIASGIWDRSDQFEPFLSDNEFKMGNGINGYSDEIVLTIRRTDSNDVKKVWGGVEVLQSC